MSAENRFQATLGSEQFEAEQDEDDGRSPCPVCGKRFEKFGFHWLKTCNYPKMSNFQIDLATGLLLGDGNVGRNRFNMTVNMYSKSKAYLLFLERLFYPVVGKGVRFSKTAKESAKHARKTGFSPQAKEKNYSDIYRFKTLKTPLFKIMYKHWYETGQRTFPNTIKLNPVVIKHWFAGDGNLIVKEREKPHAAIVFENEKQNLEKMKNMFENVGFSPTITPRGGAWFSVEETQELLNYMGEPPPGFHYKWDETLPRPESEDFAPQEQFSDRTYSGPDCPPETWRGEDILLYDPPEPPEAPRASD